MQPWLSVNPMTRNSAFVSVFCISRLWKCKKKICNKPQEMVSSDAWSGKLDTDADDEVSFGGMTANNL